MKFYGSLTSKTIMRSKEATTNRGGRDGIAAHIRTWNHGVFVEYKELTDGKVLCEIWQTGGSDEPTKEHLLHKTVLKAVVNRKPGFQSRAYGNTVSP